MRKAFIGIIAVICLGGILCGPAQGQSESPRDQLKQLKARQKQERANWKLQETNLKRSLKQQEAPKAMRLEERHRMQRDRCAMLAKQRDERQELKDKQRVLSERQKAYH